MRCSLIIPAYNAAGTIVACLAASMRQSIPRDEYEIIVVDDGSTDNTGEAAESFPVRVIRQTNGGPAAARNHGALLAKGEVLVFTDSDCEPDRDFLKNLLAPFEDPGIMGAQGSYRTAQRGFVARFCQAEIEIRYARMSKREGIDFIGSYAAAYRREAFLECGGFDTSYTAASGEDTDLSYEMHERGFKLVFRPDAVVFHRHPASLKKYLRTKFYRGYWRVRLYKKHPQKVFKDSYTPQGLKLEVLSIPLITATGAAAFGNPLLALLPAAMALFFLVSALSFFKPLRANSIPEYVFIAPMLLLRGAALFLGLLSGCCASLIRREEQRPRERPYSVREGT